MSYKEAPAPLFLSLLTMLSLMTMNNSANPLSIQYNSEIVQRFPGLRQCFREFSNQSFDFLDEVLDDMDGEQETIAVRTDTDALDGDVEGEKFLDEEDLAQKDVLMSDGTAPSSQLITQASGNSIDKNSGWRTRVDDASKGVNERTDGDYQRYGQ